MRDFFLSRLLYLRVRICLYSATLYFLKMLYSYIIFQEKTLLCIFCGRYMLRHTRNTKALRATTGCLGKTIQFRTMLDFFSSRLSISNTFIFVFTQQHSIFLKCSILTYSFERKLSCAFSFEAARLDRNV